MYFKLNFVFGLLIFVPISILHSDVGFEITKFDCNVEIELIFW